MNIKRYIFVGVAVFLFCLGAFGSILYFMNQEFEAQKQIAYNEGQNSIIINNINDLKLRNEEFYNFMLANLEDFRMSLYAFMLNVEAIKEVLVFIDDKLTLYGDLNEETRSLIQDVIDDINQRDAIFIDLFEAFTGSNG